MTYLFGIWTAVSSPGQVARKGDEDKESLASQERRCVEVALSRGWQDTGLRYVVPGQSRTRYVNLTDAEKDIPALYKLLEDAKAGKFNLLVLYDLNRLRNLMKPVKKVLENYGVQIYSVNQSTELQPPETFRPESSDSANIMVGMNEMISDWQVSDLKRKYQTFVPQRMDRGLPPLKIPWGYARPPGGDSQSVALVVPYQAEIIREIVSLFLGGKSYRQIQAHLNKLYPTPKGGSWATTYIKKILRNPFYAGKVAWQQRLTVRDYRDNTVRLVRNPEPLIKDGKHQALYSWDDYQMILIEMERRAAGPRLNVYPLTGLMVCAVCGRRIYHHVSSNRKLKREYRYWWCTAGHVKIKEDLALYIVVKALVEAIAVATDADAPATVAYDPQPILDDLAARRRRILDDREAGLYTRDEALERIAAIKAQVKRIQDAELSTVRKQQERRAFAATLEQARDIPDLEWWIRENDPAAVNALLLRLCRAVAVTPEHKVTVDFRV